MEYGQYKGFPNALREHRKAKGLSQAGVARILGFKDKTWISHWENGDAVPNLISAIRLSVLYQVPIENLFHDLVKIIQEKELGAGKPGI